MLVRSLIVPSKPSTCMGDNIILREVCNSNPFPPIIIISISNNSNSNSDLPPPKPTTINNSNVLLPKPIINDSNLPRPIISNSSSSILVPDISSTRIHVPNARPISIPTPQSPQAHYRYKGVLARSPLQLSLEDSIGEVLQAGPLPHRVSNMKVHRRYQKVVRDRSYFSTTPQADRRGSIFTSGQVRCPMCGTVYSPRGRSGVESGYGSLLTCPRCD
jgi:hypothetical protein